MKTHLIGPSVMAVVSLLVCIAAVAAGTQGKNGWQTYREPGAFRVEYPSQWYVLQEGNRRLDILSFPKDQRAQGAVLIHHGAEIQVVSAPSDVRTLPDWINQETKGESNVTKDRVPAAVKANRACTFTGLSYENELGPNTWTTNKVYFADCAGRLFQVRLIFFRGESEEKYLNVLNGMAASLRPYE
jgi:hypothetical protein